MNLVTLERRNGRAVIAGCEDALVAPGAAAECLLGIRPEDIQVLDPDANGVPARIVDEEYLGADTILRVQVGSQMLRARLPGPHSSGHQSACRLTWQSTAMHFFDAASGALHGDIQPLPPESQ